MYAKPLCYERTMIRNGQHGIHFTCYRPLTYNAEYNTWSCDSCGKECAGEFITHRLEYAA